MTEQWHLGSVLAINGVWGGLYILTMNSRSFETWNSLNHGFLFPRERATAQTSLEHKWLATSDSKMIGTGRLKSFRARRRWLVRWDSCYLTKRPFPSPPPQAVTRAARLSISFSRLKLLSSKGSGSCDDPPASPGPDDAINWNPTTPTMTEHWLH